MGEIRTTTEESDAGVLIAPQEVRELIARLTEHSVEGIPFDEPRTLTGLSLETGIPVEKLRSTLQKMQGKDRRRMIVTGVAGGAICLIAMTIALRSRPKESVVVLPQPEVQQVSPIVLPPYRPGLVSIKTVTYGPDNTDSMVDPTFAPPHTMPPGLSLSLTVDGVLWGAGDPRSGTLLHTLSADQVQELRENIIAVLQYSRSKAKDLQLATGVRGSPQSGSNAKSYSGILELTNYNGTPQDRVTIPPEGKDHDVEAAGLFAAAADKAIDSLQRQVRLQSSWRTQSGPH